MTTNEHLDRIEVHCRGSAAHYARADAIESLTAIRATVEQQGARIHGLIEERDQLKQQNGMLEYLADDNKFLEAAEERKDERITTLEATLRESSGMLHRGWITEALSRIDAALSPTQLPQPGSPSIPSLSVESAADGSAAASPSEEPQ